MVDSIYAGKIFDGKLFEGKLFGKKPLNAAMERSGVVRLWMYELYANSIDEDHKKRKIGIYAEKGNIEKPVVPKTVKKAIKRRNTKRHTAPEQKGAYTPLPPLTPVFTFTPETSTLDLAIKAIVNSPLPTLKIPRLVNVEKAIEKVDFTSEDEEEFLLMAA